MSRIFAALATVLVLSLTACLGDGDLGYNAGGTWEGTITTPAVNAPARLTLLDQGGSLRGTLQFTAGGQAFSFPVSGSRSGSSGSLR